MPKIVVSCGNALVVGIINAINMVAQLSSAEVSIDVHQDPLPRVKRPGKGRQVMVQYRALTDVNALSVIGDTTIEGLVFSHVLYCGPCTEREISDALQQKQVVRREAVEQALFKLREKTFVRSEPIGTAATATNDEVAAATALIEGEQR